jgi:hypothetical protein
MTCKEVMGYLKLNEFQLAVIIHDSGLTAYDQNLQPVRRFYITPDSIYDVIFQFDEVETYKEKHKKKSPKKKKRKSSKSNKMQNLMPLTPSEMKEIEESRDKDKGKEADFDEAISAAVSAGIFVSKQKFPVSKQILYKILLNEGAGNISQSTFEKIWDAVPSRLKKQG